MGEVLFRSDGSFWFTNAVVTRGYHGWGIAPEEVMTEPLPSFQAMKLNVLIAPDCQGGRNLRRDSTPSTFIRIAGRGRYIEDGQYFELDCVCSIEPTSYTEPKAGFWQYL